MSRTSAFFSGVLLTSVVAVIGGFLWFHYANPSGRDMSATVATASNQTPPASMQFTDIHGHKYTLQHWRGKLLLVNFWATWCAPCRKEIPYLAAAQKRYGSHGLQIIGPAVDQPSAVRQEKDVLGIDYPVMVGTPDAMMALMAQLGNTRGGIPFSVLIGPQGNIIKRQLGVFNPKQLQTLIKNHLPS